jgi:hypothetical protein
MTNARPAVGSWLEALLEQADYVGDANPRLIKGNGRKLAVLLAIRYLQHKVAFHVHLWFRPTRVEAKPCQVCAVFERRFGNGFEVLFEQDGLGVPFENGLDIDGGQEGQAGNERSVFIEIRERGQDGQYGVLRVPSLVRLFPLDECPSPSVGIKAFEWSGTAINGPIRYVPKEVPLIRIDRELVVAVGGISLRDDQLPDQVIKGRPEIVNEIPRDGTQSEGDFFGAEEYDIPARLRVVIDGYGIGTRMEKGLGAFVQRAEVFPRSLNFGVTTV